jgi:NHLM bacteriocin system ABC transporter peptidase/ATP-binding protein/NHLM bacteriocin system ABC transporter ATP-binding protein
MGSSGSRKYRLVRTPTVLQMEAAECGAAALAIILEYHGRYVPLDVLREDCGVSRDGSNAFYIKEAARRHGLEGKAIRKPADGLFNRPPPFIVFWEWNHFLVAEGLRRGRVYINDPASGRRSIGFDEFERGYSGIALTFEPGPRFIKEGKRPSALVGLVRRLSNSKTALLFVILAGLALVIPNLLLAAYQRVFIDEILIQGHRTWLKPLLWAMGVTAVFRLAAAGLEQAYLMRLEIRLTLVESIGFMWHILRLPVSFFQHRWLGDLVARASSTVRVARLISGELATTTVSLLTLVLYVAVMLPRDPLLATVGVAISSLNLVAIQWLGRWRADCSRSIEQIRGRLLAGVMGAIQMIESVKAAGSESDLLVRWSGDQARMISAEQVLGFWNNILLALPPALASLTAVAVLGLGGREVVDGAMSIGVLVAFQSLLAYFNQPFRDMARLGTDIQELRADLDRIDDVRNRPIDVVFNSMTSVCSRPSHDGQPRATGPEPLRLSGHIEFRRVTFGYNRTVEEPLVKDFSFVAQPGQRIALVGSSGSGKSTIGRLAAGLYQPWSGEILYDGKPASELSREVFVNTVEMVDSNICLFEGTVRENLTLWDETVPSDRVIQAAVDAAIHGDLLQRRGGYSAIVSEQGRNLSGGQRQRLQIARALVRDPSLLILDEATSALDPKTETIVDDNLRRRGCTCLIIAHRLTTIRDCDEIIVLSGGRVVQRGTHDELFAITQGEYARLVSHQALPGPRTGRFSLMRKPASAPTQSIVPFRGDAIDQIASWETAPAIESPEGVGDEESDPARFIVEELMPYSRPEQTAANLPLALDDPEAVWWVSSGSVDVFFIQFEPGTTTGRRRHLCRVEEGGSIFAISGVRGRAGGGLLAVGAGSAQLLKFARGDLIRLSFEEELSGQVAVLIDDWVIRVGRALARFAGAPARSELREGTIADLDRDARFGVREGVAWVRHLLGASTFLDRVPLIDDDLHTRFPVTEHLWLRAATTCRVTACDTTTMIRMGDPWAALDDFHRAALDFVAEIDHQANLVRFSEFERSIAHEAALFETVSARLAAAANTTADTLVEPSDDALMRACRAVGNYMGIEVRAPHLIGDDAPNASRDPLGDLARASGFQVRPVTLADAWWRRRGGDPLLGQLQGEAPEPVALVPAQPRLGRVRPAYELHDSQGRVRSVDLGVANLVAPTAWIFYRTLPDDPLSQSDLVAFSLKLPTLVRELAMVLVTALVGATLGLALPVASGIIVDEILPAADLPRLAIVCLFLMLIIGATAIFQAIQGLLVMRIEGRVSATLIPAFWDRLLRLPSRFFGQFSAGELASRAMELSELFKRLSGAAVATIVTGFFSFFNLGLLFYYSWKLALCTTILLAVLFFVTVLLLGGLLRYESSIRAIDGALSGLLLELLGGVSTLRTAGAESRAFSRWARRYTERLALAIRARRFASGIHRWLAIYPVLTAMVVYVGALYIDPDLMDTGSFIAFNIAFASLFAAVLDVGYTSIGLLELIPRYKRLRPILHEKPEFPAAVLEPVRLMGAVSLNHVSFRYPTQEKGAKVLDNVSLQVRPGEFVAIVGPSGSGKSTLMRLLLGFEAPDSGTVTYDGRELATLDPREVRRQIGTVLQHSELMPSDIFNNIVGFAPFLTMDDAWRAARMAGLEDDIRAMPMGMYTLVGEGGGNLSTGQKQRLLIARAIVRGPKILLFDEATSALDNVTQSIISDSLTNQLRGVTRVVIAHRLDAIINADRIYVVKDGKIVQAGRYEQLMEEPGPFRDLARRQIR